MGAQREEILLLCTIRARTLAPGIVGSGRSNINCHCGTAERIKKPRQSHMIPLRHFCTAKPLIKGMQFFRSCLTMVSCPSGRRTFLFPPLPHHNSSLHPIPRRPSNTQAHFVRLPSTAAILPCCGFHSSSIMSSPLSTVEWPASLVRKTFIDFFRDKGHTFGKFLLKPPLDPGDR